MKVTGISSGSNATVDPTSKAIRTGLYDPFGREIVKKPSAGSFITHILIRQSAATAAASNVWQMFNPATSGVIYRIRAMRVVMVFDGTAVAGNGRNYTFSKTRGVAPSSGTAVVPTKKRSGDSASTADVRFLDTGLTVTGNTTNGDPVIRINTTISVTGIYQLFEYPRESSLRRLTSPLELRPGEGLGLYITGNAAVVGQGMCGYVEWDETTS